jgi:hypothetical protein
MIPQQLIPAIQSNLSDLFKPANLQAMGQNVDQAIFGITPKPIMPQPSNQSLNPQPSNPISNLSNAYNLTDKSLTNELVNKYGYEQSYNNYIGTKADLGDKQAQKEQNDRNMNLAMQMAIAGTAGISEVGAVNPAASLYQETGQVRPSPLQLPSGNTATGMVTKAAQDILDQRSTFLHAKDVLLGKVEAPIEDFMKSTDVVSNELKQQGIKGSIYEPKVLEAATKRFNDEAKIPLEVQKETDLTNQISGMKKTDMGVTPPTEMVANAANSNVQKYAQDLNSTIKPPVGEIPIIEQAKKYKSADDFINSYDLYHGTPNKIKGGALTFGAGDQLKKGGYMGGHFLTNEPDIAKGFSFGGEVYQASGDLKNQVLDVNANKKIFEDFIGKNYVSDGEKIPFTKQDFDYMFPGGKADWSTINTDLVQQLAEKQGKIGVAIPEYANNKQGTTYQLFKDKIPVYTKSQLVDIYNQAHK